MDGIACLNWLRTSKTKGIAIIPKGNHPAEGPAFHHGQVDLATTGFTFLDMRGWGIGYAWVNGHNLGRYRSIGPQRHLFVPADWLRVGRNDIVVLDLAPGGIRTLAGGDSPIWDSAPI